MTRRLKPVLTLGVEDGGFPPSQQRKPGFKTLLVVALLSEFQLKDVRLGVITVDGLDATETLLRMLESLDWKPTAIILGGISYGGFNFIDPFRLDDAGLSSVIITMERPDNAQVKTALQSHFSDWQVRWNVYRRLRNFVEVKSNPPENPVYMESVGMTREEGAEILRRLTRIGRLAEPLRVARMLAHQLTPTSFLRLLNS